MDQQKFNELLGKLSSNLSFPRAIVSLKDLALKNELTDFDWKGLYSALFAALKMIWSKPTQYMSTSTEEHVWAVWVYMLESKNEFDSAIAASSPIITEGFLAKLMECIMYHSVQGFGKKELKQIQGLKELANDSPPAMLSISSRAPSTDSEVKAKEDMVRIARTKGKKKTDTNTHSSPPFCIKAAKCTLHWIYASCPHFRPAIRTLLSRYLTHSNAR